MEKVATWFFSLSPIAAVLGWMTYLQKDKVSVLTCAAIHKGLCAKLDIIQEENKERYDNMSKDITWIRDNLMRTERK